MQFIRRAAVPREHAKRKNGGSRYDALKLYQIVVAVQCVLLLLFAVGLTLALFPDETSRQGSVFPSTTIASGGAAVRRPTPRYIHNASHIPDAVAEDALAVAALTELPAGVESFSARYYNGVPGERALAAEERVVEATSRRREVRVDHTCSAGDENPLSAFPPSPVNPSEFWAVWEGWWLFQAGPYRFTVTARDGYRLYVDGELLTDSWHTTGAVSSESALRDMTPGRHLVRLEYFSRAPRAGGALPRIPAATARPDWRAAASASDRCRVHLRWEPDPEGVKIFVYDLPARFNAATLRGEARCDSHMFAAEVRVHEAALRSAARTLDAEAADFFLVPVYSSCAYLPKPYFGVDPWHGEKQIDRVVGYLQRWPHWARSQGEDHVFAVTYDFGACFEYKEDKADGRGVNRHLFRPVILSSLGYAKTRCFQPAKDIVIPTHTQDPTLWRDGRGGDSPLTIGLKGHAEDVPAYRAARAALARALDSVRGEPGTRHADADAGADVAGKTAPTSAPAPAPGAGSGAGGGADAGARAPARLRRGGRVLAAARGVAAAAASARGSAGRRLSAQARGGGGGSGDGGSGSGSDGGSGSGGDWLPGWMLGPGVPDAGTVLRAVRANETALVQRLQDWQPDEFGGRDIFLHFQGTFEWFDKDPDYSRGVRQTLKKLRTGDPLMRMRAGKSATYANDLRRSVFCACPRGFAPWSPRVFESIMMGCIPVIIADHIRLPFDDVLDWRGFSVKIKEADVAGIRNTLLAIPLDVIRAKQRRLREVYSAFTWQTPHAPGDAFHHLLTQLRLRLRGRVRRRPVTEHAAWS